MAGTIKTLKKMTHKHYWICDTCAKERGGFMFKTGNTRAMVTCQYCKGKKQGSQKFITPILDFRWPKYE